jgi:phage-related protein (TIGR01555 family)
MTSHNLVSMAGILDSAGVPMRPQSSPVRTAANDAGIGSALASVQGFAQNYQQSALGGMFSLDLAFAAYLGSGLLQKTIDIPAADRTRAWRDWQATDEDQQKIEAEEKRLAIRSKVKAAEVLRGLGGGALILALPGDPATPAPIPGEGGLQAINVVSRRQLQLENIDEVLTSPTYGEPEFFKVESKGGSVRIHPSRVIAFRGEPYPVMSGTVSTEDQYWGRARILRVMTEVARSDNGAKWFAELIKKAKLLRFGISNITEFDQATLNARVALIAQGENTLNATLYSLPTSNGTGGTEGGEKIDDYQVNFTGIPAMQDSLDQRVSAVADIPFTRLMGRSPGGMNATGDSDLANYHDATHASQELEVRPCLEKLDMVLLPSAGVANDTDNTWVFSPLSKANPKDEADRFDKTVTALGKIRDMGVMPELAFNAGVQGVVETNGWMPGAIQKLGDMSEGERYGIGQSAPADPNAPDPSAIQSEGGDPVLAGAGGDGSALRRRAANDARLNDATPRPLYVSRKVVNVADLKAWAKSQGLPDLQDDLHTTIAYSTTPVDWIKMGDEGWNGNDKGEITVKPGGPRVVEPLGNRTAVLMFSESALSYRNMSMREAGASWDFPDYTPHISLTGEPVDLTNVEPYRGKIVLGPEIFEVIDTTREA